MMIELLSREELILRNKVLKYPLAIAEKDYFLAVVSKIIFDSDLGRQLIFKGGTAIHHTHLPQLRFSEDLDFSSNAVKIGLDQVRDIFSGFDFLAIKKDYISGATVKIEKLQYIGGLGHAGSLKVEVDFLQNVVLPPVLMDYQNVYGVKTKVRVMDIREILAEKVRAMNDRVRYRDFYDFAMISKSMSIDLDEVIGLVVKKEIRHTISKRDILVNWGLARQQKQRDISSIYYAEELSDEEIKRELDRLDFEVILKPE